VAGWQTESSKEVFQNPWFRVRQDRVRNHVGKELTYNVVDLHHPSVFIVAMNELGRVLLQQSYRYSINRTVWEVPAGHAEDDNLLENAQRELLEETGLQSNDWTPLGTFFQAPGVGNMPFAVFLARNVQLVTDERDPDEDIQSGQFFSFDDIERNLLAHNDHAVVTAGTLTALYAAKLYNEKEQ